ncbi:MAG: YceI family protein [Bradymonadaceae bacterium]
MPTYDASDADVFIYVQRQTDTLLSSMGHDLKLRVGDFSIDVDAAAGEVSAEFDAASLEPVDAIKWESREETGELSDGDRHEIGQRIDTEVLDVGKYPTITFESTEVEETDDGWRVAGELDLHGELHDVEVEASRDADRLRAETVVDHTEWGVEPYSAMLGSLKVDPEVAVTVAVPAPEDGT